MTLSNPFKFLPALQIAVTLALGLSINMPAHADSGVSYRLGTFGFGVDYNQRLRETVTLRLGYNFYVMSRDADSDGVQYDAKVKIMAASLLMDWHYANSPWRLTMGVSQSGPRIEAQGAATGDVTLNGQTYSADQLGNIDMHIKPGNAIAPYVGIGYGYSIGAAEHFTFLADIGALYVGAPTIKVNAGCGSALTSAECDQLQANIHTEVTARENEWRDYQWWPVLSVGFAMRW
jgi:hypothetical protein